MMEGNNLKKKLHQLIDELTHKESTKLLSLIELAFDKKRVGELTSHITQEDRIKTEEQIEKEKRQKEQLKHYARSVWINNKYEED